MNEFELSPLECLERQLRQIKQERQNIYATYWQPETKRKSDKMLKEYEQLINLINKKK